VGPGGRRRGLIQATEADLFAVQPRVGLDEYLDPLRFAAHHEALADRVDALRAASGGARPGLVVWPEYVATFLVLAGRAREVAGCTTTEQALRRIVTRHPLALAGVMARHRVLHLAPAVLTMLAPGAHRIWVETFSAIARRLRMWVVAGTGLFPRPSGSEDDAPFVARSAEVFNTSATFAPDGRLVSTTRKVNLVPTQEDVLGLSAASAAELTVIDTDVGQLGTLVCYDGFHEAHTSREPTFVPCGPVLDALGAEVVAQPSANAWPWDAPWAFNDPGEQQLRSEQWFSEGMARALRDLRSVRYVVNPQLVGDVLDNHFEAPSMILERRDSDIVVLATAQDAHAETVVHTRVGLGAGR
jgi:predicted amidohydrolase